MKEILFKLKFLTNKNQRKSLFFLSGILIFGMILEIFGLGIIVPMISLIIDPDFIQTNVYVEKLFNILGPINHLNLVLGFLVSIIFIYILKTFFLIFLSLKQNRFLSNLSAHLSVRLFTNYMNQSYLFHLNSNSSTLNKNIQIEINFFKVFCISLLTVFTEFFLLIAVIATLIYIEPLGAILIGLFLSLLSLIFFQFTKNKLKLWGIERQNFDEKISKTTLEAIGGIKDLIILGRQKYFIKLFKKKIYLKAHIESNHSTISQLPRFYLELVSIIALVIFIFIMILQNKDTTGLISTLAVFVAAVFRMIPSINKIIASYQDLKYYNSSIDVLYNELKLDLNQNKELKNLGKVNLNNKITISDLHFKYGDEPFVLKKINLTINKGETIGVVGPSGSGKSSLIDLISGLHIPSSGEIMVDGISIFNNIRGWQDKIGYVGQTIFLKNNSIRENIAFGLSENKINNKAVIDSLKAAQLENFIDSLPEGLNTIVGERGSQLSGGQRQRIGIARALYNNPDVLILDEATASLDTKTEFGVMQSISLLRGIKTIIIISHRLSTLKNCDFVYSVNKGVLSKIND